MVIPVHHPRDEPPRVFTTDEIGRAKRDLSPLENRLVDFSVEESDGRRKTEGGDVVLLIYEILYSALSSQKVLTTGKSASTSETPKPSSPL